MPLLKCVIDEHMLAEKMEHIRRLATLVRTRVSACEDSYCIDIADQLIDEINFVEHIIVHGCHLEGEEWCNTLRDRFFSTPSPT